MAEWYRWHVDHPAGRLSSWLANQLVVTYPQVPLVVAQQLVDAGLVLPLLDGLDEVPVAHRGACNESIEAYMERSMPFRPLLLTCRPAEYVDLAPGWVGADRVIALIGLEPDQVRSVLEAETSAWTTWASVRERVVNGEPGLIRLFRSPLRLAIALQAYARADPSELVTDEPGAHAEARLWDRLLAVGEPSFRGAEYEQIRSWLCFLATSMARQGRQRFWLHELYLQVPQEERGSVAVVRPFGGVVRLAVGLSEALLLGLGLGTAFGAYGLSLALIVAPFFGLAAGVIADNAPLRVRAIVSWRARVHAGMSRPSDLFAGVLLGVAIGFQFGPAFIVTLGSAFGLMGISMRILTAGSVDVPIATDPPERLVAKGPRAVLTACATYGLLCASIVGLLFALAVGLPVGRNSGPADGIVSGLAVGLGSGLIVGMEFGLGGWLYHHWLRRHLARSGVLPRRLPEFLDWCTLPPRQWLRVTDAYEFRHRDLLEHLATAERG